MRLKANFKYNIVQRDPHLLLDSGQQILILLDTGFNGEIESVGIESFHDVPEGRFNSAIWLGSKAILKAGEIVDINYADETLEIINELPDASSSMHKIKFNESRSCTMLQRIVHCPLGPIVTIPIIVKQNGKSFIANGFVDTGSGYSLVLRGRLNENSLSDIKIEECVDYDNTTHVEIDEQTILYKERPFELYLVDTNNQPLDTKLNHLHLACGKNDAVSSDEYNDKLALIDLKPYVDVTVGNDAFLSFHRMIIDYKNRDIYLSKRNSHGTKQHIQPLRQISLKSNKNDKVFIIMLILAGLWLNKNKLGDKETIVLILIILFLLK